MLGKGRTDKSGDFTKGAKLTEKQIRVYIGRFLNEGYSSGNLINKYVENIDGAPTYIASGP